MKKYYVKMNGKVFNVPEETYLSFKNEIKDFLSEEFGIDKDVIKINYV